jgi:hypothetical protein
MATKDSAVLGLISKLLGGKRQKRYAVEVDAIHADSFDIPVAEICES